MQTRLARISCEHSKNSISHKAAAQLFAEAVGGPFREPRAEPLAQPETRGVTPLAGASTSHTASGAPLARMQTGPRRSLAKERRADPKFSIAFSEHSLCLERTSCYGANAGRLAFGEVPLQRTTRDHSA
jgi:hypothetical protein